MESLRVLCFGGSLRKGSYSGAVMREAAKLAPRGMEVEAFDISQIPVFNQDADPHSVGAVAEFKAKIKAADALLIVTPEYNYSVPGYLKNALDWASRPYGDNSFDDKPAAVISSSTGIFGGIRAQQHLRQVLVYLNAHALNRPEVAIGQANKKIDENGKITDEETKKRVSELLQALAAWTERLGKR